jgi:hypothetical protein
MKCAFCSYEILGKRHEMLCVYNPINTRKIVLYLKNYVLIHSGNNKNFRPFPSAKEFDEFCRQNKISRVKTIAARYFEDDYKLNDFLIELLDYALSKNIVGQHEFPFFLQFIYDAWIFYSAKEYREIYEGAIQYENGDALMAEVSSSHFTSSSIIKRLRSEGKLFQEEQRSVSEFLP